METLRAAIGDENMLRAFWLMAGSLVLSNAGLIVGAIVAHVRKVNKLRTDLNKAFERIRALENQGEKK